MTETPPTTAQRPPLNGKALLALIMSVMFYPLTGLIALIYFFWADMPRPAAFLLIIGYWIVAAALAVVGLRQIGQRGERGRGLAIAALVSLVVVGGFLGITILT